MIWKILSYIIFKSNNIFNSLVMLYQYFFYLLSLPVLPLDLPLSLSHFGLKPNRVALKKILSMIFCPYLAISHGQCFRKNLHMILNVCDPHMQLLPLPLQPLDLGQERASSNILTGRTFFFVKNTGS